MLVDFFLNGRLFSVVLMAVFVGLVVMVVVQEDKVIIAAMAIQVRFGGEGKYINRVFMRFKMWQLTGKKGMWETKLRKVTIYCPIIQLRAL